MQIDALRARLGSGWKGRLDSAADDAAAPYLLDHRKRWRGRALALAMPDTPQDVARLVAVCAQQRIPIVPQGGNTGLVGGSVPDESGTALLLSLRRLNRIRALDRINQTITCEAGCVLQTVQAAADEADALFPLSLAAEGSCTIGGNLSTNAGGVQVLRYGNARDLCLGLEVVTPAGEIWSGLRGLRKDNTGYDLRDLYIGAEGTLGIITAAVLKLFPRPRGTAVAMVALHSAHAALDLLHLMRDRLDAGLTAFELMADECLQLVERHVPGARHPFATRPPWSVLLQSNSHQSEDAARQALQAALEPALESGLAQDAVLAGSGREAARLWALRENISGAQAAEGRNIKHDVSVPISRIADFIGHNSAALQQRWPDLRMIVFGHVGDGNLHYNVSPPQGQVPDAAFHALQDEVNRITHDNVVAHGGSISAEHGLGVLRRDEAARHRPAVETALMQSLKSALDPQGIMNPGRVLPVRTMQ